MSGGFNFMHLDALRNHEQCSGVTSNYTQDKKRLSIAWDAPYYKTF